MRTLIVKTIFLLLIFSFSLNFFRAQIKKDLFLFDISKIKTSKDHKNNFKDLTETLDISESNLNKLNFLINQKNTKYYYLDSIIKANKLPPSFSCLPLVISGYQTNHKSEFSARGIWALSFIAALNKGLTMNNYIDERLNDKVATIAAVEILKTFSKKYKSDNWTLLAFITSPNYVSNIINKAKSNKWVVAKKLIEYKYLFNINLINWLSQIEIKENKNPPYKSQETLLNFTFKEDILFDAISHFKVLNFKEINKKNPFLIGQVLPKKYKITLQENMGNFILKYEDKIIAFQDSMLKDLFYNPEPIFTNTIYKVKYGDVLGQIAIDNNVSMEDLMKWNNLSNSMIYQEQKLTLFSKSKKDNENIYLYSVNKQKYFWELVEEFPQNTIKKICKYNNYQELNHQQKLKIIDK